MLELPLEMIYFIAEKLNFRSLVQLRLTCSCYAQLLNDLVASRKQELFTKYTLTDEENAIKYIPGPAIKELPRGFPIDGIYFFEVEDYHARADVNFFFRNFDGFLKNSHDTKYIATIKTKTKKIHKHDLGCHNLSPRCKSPGHWNDLDGDYRVMFHQGKQIIKEFWRAL